MNKERLLELADIIENHKYMDHKIGFNMAHSLYDYAKMGYNGDDDLVTADTLNNKGCGSVCCIAGVTAIVFDKDNVTIEKIGDVVVHKWRGQTVADTNFDAVEQHNRNSIFTTAQLLLGLSYEDAKNLFFPQYAGWGGFSYYPITPKMAANTIRRFVETGTVNWVPEWEEYVTQCDDPYAAEAAEA